MIVTAAIGSAYMWYKKVPGFPLGPPGVRGLLLLRGAAGTIGLFGLYCKMAQINSRRFCFVFFYFFILILLYL